MGGRPRRYGSVLTAVMIAGVLLMQHLPAQPFLNKLTAGPGHGGCTEQVCHCDDDCSCTHCAHDHEAAGPSETGATTGSATTERAPSPESPTMRSCGGVAPGSPGVLVVSKSLFAPAMSLKAASWSSPPAYLSWRGVAAPQQVADELFRPPRRRIG